MTKTSTKATALDAFIAKKAQIDAMLARLSDLSDDHFNVTPDDVNWGHVGTLQSYLDLLRRISDAAFQEGEHAQQQQGVSRLRPDLGRGSGS